MSSVRRLVAACRKLHSSALASAKAPPPAAAKKGGAKKLDDSNTPGVMDPNVATGVNLLKGKSDPQLGPDDAYPDWLWTLTAPKPLEAELQGKLDAAGYTGKPGPTPQELPITIDEGQRLLYLQRKRTIKASNGRSSKAA